MQYNMNNAMNNKQIRLNKNIKKILKNIKKDKIFFIFY